MFSLFSVFKKKEVMCVVTTPINTYKGVCYKSIDFNRDIMYFNTADGCKVEVEKDTALITLGFITTRACVH